MQIQNLPTCLIISTDAVARYRSPINAGATAIRCSQVDLSTETRNTSVRSFKAQTGTAAIVDGTRTVTWMKDVHL